MQIKDLTTDELKALIQDTITDTLQKSLDEPDWDKELKEEVRHRLNISIQQTAAGERSVSAEEVAKKIGLT